MASQKQESSPGREHVMNPIPQYSNPDYKPSNKLQGKVALVTAGDAGIGRAVCHCFAQEGVTVAFTYLKGQGDKSSCDTLEMIKQVKTLDSKDPIAVSADLGYEKNCSRVVEEVSKAYGCIDILVNNASKYDKNSLVWKLDQFRLERVFRTNIFSYFLVTRHALKHMKKGSSIICSTPVNAYKGNQKLLDYTATEGAIMAFVRGLSLEIVNKGIRVNGVAILDQYGPRWFHHFLMRKLQTLVLKCHCSELGSLVRLRHPTSFLLPMLSSYITGQVIHPNGGVVN